MNAVINGDRIECGKCKALLFKHYTIEKGILTFDQPVCLASLSAKIDSTKNKGKVTRIEIKCKHKDCGIYCNEVNEILL